MFTRSVGRYTSGTVSDVTRAHPRPSAESASPSVQPTTAERPVAPFLGNPRPIIIPPSGGGFYWESMGAPNPDRAARGSGGSRRSLLAEPLADELRDLLDPLRDRDPGFLHALDLGRRRVFLALDDRARVPEAHALHLVHEAAGHE